MSLTDIRGRIAKAAETHGRNADDITLIAVSKVQPNERVASVLKEGHRVFGENRLQEADGKWPGFKESYPDTQLHLIGPLQTNKVRAAMALFDAIHVVDRVKLARTIARIADETGACPELFLQVNTGDEAQKAGVALADLDALFAECRTLDLPVKGLMCLPPQNEAPSLHFALLAKRAKALGLDQLSMGMSGDFEAAIAQGATHIRVGSAIFGARGTG